MKGVLILAAQTAKELPELTPGSRPITSDITLLLGAIGGVVLLVLLWAIFIRGPKKHPEDRDRKPLGANPNPSVTITEDGRERVRKKKRVRRRDHRDRNPTLAETGGLPPQRDPQESTPI